MHNGMQRQRHGVKKHLVEGAGGLLVGAALVMLLRTLARRRTDAVGEAPVPKAVNG